MTTRTDFTVDWDASPRIVTIAAPSTEATIQDIVDTLRVLEYEVRGMSEPKLIDATGKQPLGGGVNVGITCSLQNALIEFEDRAGPTFEQCLINGGNLVAFDDMGAVLDSPIQVSDYTQVVLTSSSSATLQELQDIQYASFNGGVWIDTVSGSSGTIFPIGTEREPVDNFTDGLTIANARGFNTFFVVGDATVDTGLNYTDFVFIGQGQNLSTLTITAAANVTNCSFEQALVTGTLDGDSSLVDCIIEDLDFISGIIERCLLNPGTITLGGSSTAHFINCASGVPGVSTPVVDMGGAGQALALRNFNGGIELRNKTGADAVSLDMNSGQIILDSTVTSGDIVCRGIAKLTDNSVGANVIDELITSQITTLENISRNKMVTDPVTGILTVYDTDDVTVLFTAQLYEDTAGGQTYRGQGAERRERLT